MTKTEFLDTITKLYRFGNKQDSEYKSDWTKPEMAGRACCASLDEMLRALQDCGVITSEEKDELYDNL